MYGLVLGIIIFVSILLVLVVLVQNPKGGGLASGFSSSNQIMGVKRTADFVEKITWGFAGALLLLSVITTMIPRSSSNEPKSQIQEQLEAPVTNPDRLPTYPVTPSDETVPEQDQDQQ